MNAPKPAYESLVLLDEWGRALDQVAFEVRGVSPDMVAPDAATDAD